MAGSYSGIVKVEPECDRYYYFEAGGTRNRLDFETGEVHWKLRVKERWLLWFEFNELDDHFVGVVVEQYPELKHVRRIYRMSKI